MDLQPKAVAIQPLPATQRAKHRYGPLSQRGSDAKQPASGRSDLREVSDNEQDSRGNLAALSDVSVRRLHAGRTEIHGGNPREIDPPFRQLSIGSPVPCLDRDDEVENDDDERFNESRGSVPTNPQERYFAHDCIITKKVSPKPSTPILTKRKNTTPSIKVDRCEGQYQAQVSLDDNYSSDGSCSGSPNQGDGIPPHSPPGDGKLLSPTHPPACRMSGEHRGACAVTYHNTTPLAALSRSENSITDAIIKEGASFKTRYPLSSPGSGRNSPRMSRSGSGTPISVTNTDVLRSPASSPRRQRRVRGASSEDLPKLDYRHESWGGGRALRGTLAGHSPGRTPTSSPVRGEPTPRHPHLGVESTHPGGRQTGSDLSFPKLK